MSIDGEDEANAIIGPAIEFARQREIRVPTKKHIAKACLTTKLNRPIGVGDRTFRRRAVAGAVPQVQRLPGVRQRHHEGVVAPGVLTDESGRPVAVNVYEGNTADPSIVGVQLRKIKEEFELEVVAFVGDRGMLAQTVINDMLDQEGFGWITALKSGSLRKLRAEGHLQMVLFDQRDIFEFNSEHARPKEEGVQGDRT